MESTEDLLRKFRKRDLLTELDPQPTNSPVIREGQFVQIRRKGLVGDAAGLDQPVSQEALIDDDGVVGLAG